ncbi:MAG: EAL domain-containing protein [Gammaproteobacteria bacterium]|nr:EAL domain-containing protein [Gammaproteobacteria bacterium]
MTNPRQRASDHLHTTGISTQNATNLAHSGSSENPLPIQPDDTLPIFGDGLVGINKDGNINFINKTACKLTGWLQSDAENKPFEEIFQLSDDSSETLNLKLIQHIIKSGHLIAPLAQQVIKTKNNKKLHIDFSISPLDGNTAIIMFHQLEKDLTNKNHPLLYQVNYDPLTHLSNRIALQKIINTLHDSAQSQGKTYSILLLDLDHFKLINDRYGHDTGDQLLQLVAERIQFVIRDKDTIGRWAGEEFLCILPDADPAIAAIVAERLHQCINKQCFHLNQREIFLTASIGIASYPNDGTCPEELFCIADATLYEAKQNGRNQVNSSKGLISSIFTVGNQLEQALQNQKIISVYQPIFDIQNGVQIAEETLARIQEDNGDLIEANHFIDAAVRLQLIHRIDDQVIRQTITRCCINAADNKTNFPHFVNISADFLRRPELIKGIFDFARKEFIAYGLSERKNKPLVIEITEQELLHDIEEVKKLLAPFIEFGCELAIDDFGSGYSSLTYLADLPISYLKFDGALIKRVAYEDRARKIISGIQKLAESLDLITIAEHIEDQATLDVLRELGVSWGQGYFSAKPSI